jgi:hypothetical protein
MKLYIEPIKKNIFFKYWNYIKHSLWLCLTSIPVRSVDGFYETRKEWEKLHNEGHRNLYFHSLFFNVGHVHTMYREIISKVPVLAWIDGL